MTNPITIATLAGLAVLATPAMAQQAPATAPAAPERPKEPRDKAIYFTQEQMAAIADGVVDKATGKPGAFSKRLLTYSTHSTAFIRLTKAEGPHAHGTWSEIFVVTAGGGVLETGGTITGVTGNDSATHRDIFLDPQAPPPPTTRRVPNPGDLAGTGVTGGYKQRMKPGDIVLIPAGVSHRWVEVDAPGITYLDIKFPKAD